MLLSLNNHVMEGWGELNNLQQLQSEYDERKYM
jgi:hypothetical protein